MIFKFDNGHMICPGNIIPYHVGIRVNGISLTVAPKDLIHYLIEIRDILYLSYIYPIKMFLGMPDFVVSQKVKSSPSAILG